MQESLFEEEIIPHKFPYNWTLKDAVFTKDKGKVFSCFACGGGSTMGYKLAGFDVLGCNEIDPKMIEAYKANHNPKYAFQEPIQTFKLRKDLPKELYELDILDGSPPCSSFSMAGNREKDWGKEKKFREGQEKQILDTLFFDFIDLAKELQPKVVVAENVKGMLQGEAVEYVKKVLKEFFLAGYLVQHYLLNASKMGVPQRRERVFFIAIRKDLAFKVFGIIKMHDLFYNLKMNFKEPPINIEDLNFEFGDNLKGFALCEMERLENKEPFKYLQTTLVKYGTIFPTLTTGYQSKASPMIEGSDRWLNKNDICKIGSYPNDYNFLKIKPPYLIGMSVPPVMSAQVSLRIYEQFLSKL